MIYNDNGTQYVLNPIDSINLKDDGVDVVKTIFQNSKGEIFYMFCKGGQEDTFFDKNDNPLNRNEALFKMSQ